MPREGAVLRESVAVRLALRGSAPMAHEKSITIQRDDGRLVNILTVLQRIAVGMFRTGRKPQLGGAVYEARED
jgi:hypothetical protein